MTQGNPRDVLDVRIDHGKVLVPSALLAEILGRDHGELAHIIRSLECDEAFHRANFLPSSRGGAPAWRITKDGFMALMLHLGAGGNHGQWVSQCLQSFARTEMKLTARSPRRRGRPRAVSGGLLPVPFQGATLFVVDHQGEPYAPMKPIVEGMGLDWRSQHRKLTSDTDRWGMVIMTIPSDGGYQETASIPLRKVAGWLMTVSPNKVRPALREKIIAYQRECDDVLWRHWTGSRSSAPAQPATPPITRQAGPYVLDSEFFRTLHLALGRRAVQTEIVFRLLRAGALDQPVRMSCRALGGAGEPGAIPPSRVQWALDQLLEEGVVARTPGSLHLRIVGDALEERLGKLAGPGPGATIAAAGRRPVNPLDSGEPHV